MRAAVAIAGVAMLLAGCSQPAALAIENAVVRLPAVPGRPGAAYFTLKGGAHADTLVAARTPAANRTELHESSMAGGVMRMAQIRDVPVPAGGTLRFEPGGKHVMLFDMNPALKAGGKTRITLQFASGTTLEAEAKLLAPGDTASGGGHAH